MQNFIIGKNGLAEWCDRQGSAMHLPLRAAYDKLLAPAQPV